MAHIVKRAFEIQTNLQGKRQPFPKEYQRENYLRRKEEKSEVKG